MIVRKLISVYSPLQRSSHYWAKQENSGNSCGRRVGGFGLIYGDMKAEKGVLLRLIPPGCSMDLGQGYDDNDRLHQSSLSQHLM